MTETIDWLRAKAQGFNQLTEEEVGAISDFSLLWALFESRLLNTEGSARAICDVVDGWAAEGSLDLRSVEPELAYFRQRYFANGDFTDHFHHLHLRRNDQEALVRAVISGTDNDPRGCLAVVLIIIFRYRNNLFHGVKWQYMLAGQLGNFAAANTVLKKVLDRHGALVEG